MKINIPISWNTRKPFLSTLLMLMVINLFGQPFKLYDRVSFDPTTSKGVLENGMRGTVRTSAGESIKEIL
jgi:hypothetical protein